MLNWFKKRYFGEDTPLEYHVFMIFFFEIFILSVISTISEIGVLNYGVLGSIVQWGYLIASVVFMLLPTSTRIKMQKPMMLVVAFVYGPFLYLQSAGHQGTMLMFSLLVVFMLSFAFKGKQAVVVIGLNTLFYMILAWAGYTIPGLVIPYGDEESVLLDILESVPMCFIALATMVVYVRKAYDESNRGLVRLATKDELTGIYNRRSLTELLDSKLSSDRAEDSGFIVMMLDIDHFKNVNDTYGHGYGDLVLRTFAETAQRTLRHGDVLARYGGEEFVVVLDAVKMDGAIEIAERIRKAIKEVEFDVGLKVTVSIGLARSESGDTMEKLLGRADENLYKAKESGRDRVVYDHMEVQAI